ncbi:MAG: NAD(+)/NADH kinase [Gemmatimonadetes bacterium]|nr:NAD(+)/NADH kinase [Gemmatimonadota bacterium]
MSDESVPDRSDSSYRTGPALEAETPSTVSRSNDRSVNVTDGRLFKPLLLLSAPIVLTGALDIVYFIIDLYWIGYLGADAVAAMSYSWPVIFLIMSIGLGLATAGTVLVAQNKGASRVAHMNTVAGGTLSFVTIVSIVLAIIGYAFTPWLLALVGATPGTDPHTLAVRPIVVAGNARITIEVLPPWGEEEVFVSHDGQVGQALGKGHRVVITRSAFEARLVRLETEGFFALMRRKLQWGDITDRE